MVARPIIVCSVSSNLNSCLFTYSSSCLSFVSATSFARSDIVYLTKQYPYVWCPHRAWLWLLSFLLVELIVFCFRLKLRHFSWKSEFGRKWFSAISCKCSLWFKMTRYLFCYSICMSIFFQAFVELEYGLMRVFQ